MVREKDSQRCVNRHPTERGNKMLIKSQVSEGQTDGQKDAQRTDEQMATQAAMISEQKGQTSRGTHTTDRKANRKRQVDRKTAGQTDR